MYNPEKNIPFEKPSTSASTEEISESFENEELEQNDTKKTQNQPIFEKDKYSPEARQEQITDQATMIRKWATEQGLKEGKDFLIIENIKDVVGKDGEILPHETKAFYMAIHENQYRKFRDYFMSQYKEEMKQKDPANEVRLNYSWGGRFCVGWAGVPCDTVAASDIENITVPTHHQEFKSFFKSKAGFDFPSAQILNPVLKEMSDKGLTSYESALIKLNELKDTGTLPDDGYGLIDNVIRAIELLKKAKSGSAVEELPEELKGEMPIGMRTYAELTYNAEDIGDFNRVKKITGIEIPEEARIDKIFKQFNFDRNQMEQICKDFSDYLMAKREI